MRVKATHETIRQIVHHAREIELAFGRFQDLISTAVIDAPESVRERVGAILFDMNYVPLDAIYAIRAVEDFYKDESATLERKARAVRQHRARVAQGDTTRPYQRRTQFTDGPKRDATPETYTSEEYAAMVAASAKPSAGDSPETFIIEKSEGHTIETKIERDATPTKGVDLSF